MKSLVLVLLMLTLTPFAGSPRLTAQGRGGVGGSEGAMATPQLPMHLVDNFLKYPSCTFWMTTNGNPGLRLIEVQA